MRRVIAHLVGGLGNQLFVYAAAWALAQRAGADLILDVSAFRRDARYRRTYALDCFKLGEVSLRDGAWAAESIHRNYRRARLLLPLLPPRLGPIAGERSPVQYEPLNADLLRSFPALHLFGYRQNEAYFTDQADALRRKLEFVFSPSEEARTQADEIRACNAVGVHVRQLLHVRAGGTEPDPHIRQLDETYYHAAIAAMRERIPAARFFCFADRHAGLDRLLPPGVAKVVSQTMPDPRADVRDLWLMTHCRHFIIANSSFSWWAAWLGAQPGSIVFCPKTRGFEYQIAPARGWEVI